jgi:hypothetical protein
MQGPPSWFLRIGYKDDGPDMSTKWGALTHIHHRMWAAKREYFELVQKTIGVYICPSTKKMQLECVYSPN